MSAADRVEAQLEAVLDLVLSDLVDDRERYLGPDGERWEPLGAGGSQSSHYWTPQRFDEARATSRVLCEENPFACNAIENRISYVVGAGHTYRVDPAPGLADHDATPAEVAAFLDAFRAANNWYARQIENSRRVDRDGELFLRLFTAEDGMTLLRYVDPERIRAPQDAPDRAPLGVEHAPRDAETPALYWIDDEPVDAALIQHRKPGVDATVTRGIPLFWPVRKNLRRAALLLRNMSALVEVQTSIALIRKHRGLSASGIETFADSVADATRTNSATGQTTRLKQYGPGTILDVPAGKEYEFPSIGVDSARIVEPLRAELRSIAARLVMPEFMFTSDASNAAYASTMVAEGPAVRNFERLQWMMIADDLSILRIAVARAVAAGALPPDALAKTQITAEAPHVQVRDFLKLNTVHSIAHKAGILSPQTWSQKLGLDYNREQQQLAQHAAAAGADRTPDPPNRTTPVASPPPPHSAANP